jgi:1-acyl-sn-glycerol-3-phosphate acyltransferase
LQDFKPGIGRLLHHFRVPVVPAIIRGSYEAMPRGSFLQSFHSIRVNFGRPLDSSRLESEGEGKEPYQRIIHGLRSHMQDMLDESPQRE